MLAGLCFIAPTAVLLALFAKYYDQLVQFSSLRHLLDGLKVGALVVICQSIFNLVWSHRYQLSGWFHMGVAFFLMQIASSAEPLIIILGGVTAWAFSFKHPGAWAIRMPSAALILSILWVHMKAGALVFGPGLAILSVLQKEVVEKFQWLSQAEFTDAFSLTQVIPGPVTTLSSFIGFQIAGPVGSLAALLGIYLPSVFFILFLLPLIRQWVEGRDWFQSFYQGAFFAVIGCLSATSVQLFTSTLMSVQHQITFLVLFVVQMVFSTPLWLTLISGSAVEWVLN